MFDVAAFAVPAAMGFLGGLVGARLTRRPPLPKTPALLCSCDHGYGIHAEGGLCRAQVRRVRNGCTSVYDWVPCGCLVYDGPEPLPRVWTSPGGLP
jgi:hypothetical protein